MSTSTLLLVKCYVNKDKPRRRVYRTEDIVLANLVGVKSELGPHYSPTSAGIKIRHSLRDLICTIRKRSMPIKKIWFYGNCLEVKISRWAYFDWDKIEERILEAFSVISKDAQIEYV